MRGRDSEQQREMYSETESGIASETEGDSERLKA